MATNEQESQLRQESTTVSAYLMTLNDCCSSCTLHASKLYQTYHSTPSMTKYIYLVVLE